MDKQKDFCTTKCRSLFYFHAAARACARGRFSFSVKGLCAPRGPEAELVFSLSWFSRWWRGAGFILSVKWLCAPRGAERFYVKWNCSLLMSKENLAQRKSALTPRHRRAIPLKLNQNTLPTAYKHFTRSSRYSGSLGSRLLMTTPPLAAAPVEWIYRPSPK